MLQFKKNTRFDRTRPGSRPINFEVIRVFLSLLMLLWLAPASAGPASLLKGIMQESSSKPASGQSWINPVALIEEIKLKLAATNAELALVPSEAVAGASATGASGDEEILARRLRLRQLVFLYQGQLARLASLQLRQQQLLLSWKVKPQTGPDSVSRSFIPFSGQMSLKNLLLRSAVEWMSLSPGSQRLSRAKNRQSIPLRIPP